MSFHAILLFAMTEFILCLIPGPAVLCILSQGMRHGSRKSLRGALGVITGNAIYFGLSTLGLGAVLLASKTLYLSIKWIGAGYLMYLGLKMLFSTFANSEETLDVEKCVAVKGRRMFLQGLTVQLSNPKAIVYFTALLPQFVTTDSSIPLQFLVLGIISILIEFPVLVIYGWGASTSRRIFRQKLRFAWFERIAGTLLIGAGLKLAFLKE
jgi:threonine/homoserine/homoserine lactone efflux protein